MATVEKRGNTYRIRASAGYDVNGEQIRPSMTWKPAPRRIQISDFGILRISG